MNNKTLFHQIIDSLKDIFPKHAEISYVDNTIDYKCKISWKLNHDLHRPNMRSKTINIIISEEALDQFAKYDNNKQKKSCKNIVEFIKNKYQKFDPNHNKSINEPPPIVRWVIKSNLIDN